MTPRCALAANFLDTEANDLLDELQWHGRFERKLAIKFFGYRMPSAEVLAAACDGTTSLPENSFS